ncbi:hypothetical protein SE17_02505 [Kouleothrix aurantiaca]|uniref:Uncharacterized protein n=1 Tax=Kouleothrix aurantiaca TaxID=186479 RepID=A0A0P9FN15_9CHLR|nr:hypothetical protein SE17_02505 [Kouleothrix aurantiaca]
MFEWIAAKRETGEALDELIDRVNDPRVTLADVLEMSDIEEELADVGGLIALVAPGRTMNELSGINGRIAAIAERLA